jgi:hypothetical protein
VAKHRYELSHASSTEREVSVNNRLADWYVDQYDPTFLRWWDGTAWADRYVPNIAYPQPDLPRYFPRGARLGVLPRTPLSQAVTSLPGWYEHGGSVRWWDGIAWTDLYYPKRFGVNLGGGSATGYLIGLSITIVLAFPLFFIGLLGILRGAELFGMLFLLIFAADVFIGFILKANLNHMSKLRDAIQRYSLAPAGKLRNS